MSTLRHDNGLDDERSNPVTNGRVQSGEMPHAVAMRAYVTCQLVGWIAYGALLAVFFRLGDAPVLVSVTVPAVLAFGGLVLSHVLRARVRRWLDLRLGRLAVRMVIASVLLGLVLNTFSHGLAAALGWVQTFDPRAFAIYVFNVAVVFLMWQMLYVAIHLFQRWRTAELARVRLQVVAQEAELRHLKAQLNPHFLFNALNTVRGTIVEDPVRAQQLVTGIANILRSTLTAAEQDLVPLERELELVRDYLAIEQARLEDRLAVTWELDPQSLRGRVPVLLLQTLVENGIKHAISKLPAGGAMQIHSRVTDGRIEIQISHPRAPEGAASDSTGTGLKNATARLELLYGDAARIVLRHEGASTITTLEIPA
jgi:hypothetical protein